MRRIAAEAGCSTSVLYTMFGAKAGIAEALWREGFDRLSTALDQVTGADPLQRLAAMGRAYRANALANRSYYAIMFQRPIPGFQPSPDAYRASLQSLQALTDSVADCVRAGVFRSENPGHIAGVLWAATHGAVSLELAGYEGAVDAEHRFDALTTAAAAWFMASRPPPNDLRRFIGPVRGRSVQRERSGDDLACRLVGADHDSSSGERAVDEPQPRGNGALREQSFARPDHRGKTHRRYWSTRLCRNSV